MCGGQSECRGLIHSLLSFKKTALAGRMGSCEHSRNLLIPGSAVAQRQHQPPWLGAFLLEPTGLSTGLLPGPREMEYTLFLLGFKDRGGTAAACWSQLCLGSHRSSGADRLCSWESCLVSLDLSVCVCEMGVMMLRPRVVVREDYMRS